MLYVVLSGLALFVFLSICYTQVSLAKKILISVMLPDLIKVVHINEGISCGGTVLIPPAEFQRLGKEH